MKRQFERIARWVSAVGTRNPFGVVLQTGRSILAAGTLLTLLANGPDVLFHTPGGGDDANCTQLGTRGLYCLLGAENLEFARWLSVGACLLVILGLVPALSSALYWFAAFSLFANAKPIDGGDQLTAILGFVLMVASVFDWRLFAWRRSHATGRRFVAARVILLFIPLQMSYLYLNSAVGSSASRFGPTAPHSGIGCSTQDSTQRRSPLRWRSPFSRFRSCPPSRPGVC